MRKILLPLVTVTVLLPGCQTWGPTWSEVTGQRYNVTIFNRRPAIIERIDEQGSFATMPVKIDPGMKRVVLSAPTTGWAGGSKLEVFMLDAKPCKRYYLNAQFDNPLEPEFRPVIDYVEDIAGCTIEAKK